MQKMSQFEKPTSFHKAVKSGGLRAFWQPIETTMKSALFCVVLRKTDTACPFDPQRVYKILNLPEPAPEKTMQVPDEEMTAAVR